MSLAVKLVIVDWCVSIRFVPVSPLLVKLSVQSIVCLQSHCDNVPSVDGIYVSGY